MIISYIIPCYNVESFISKCIESIINQNLNYDDYEIIAINDGSTDKTLQKLEKLQDNYRDLNLIIINQQNQGPSCSRNLGLSIANGKYIWFVDSDDYLTNHVSKDLLEYIEVNNLDILWFDHRLVDENNHELPLPVEDNKSNVPIGKIYEGTLFLENYFGRSCMVWSFIFSREFLLDNSLKFIEGRYFEDILFTTMAIDQAKKFSFLNILSYNYLIRNSGSIMRDPLNYQKRTLDALFISIEMKRYAEVANSKKYFLEFSNIMTTYHLRQSSKVSKKFFLHCYQLSNSNGLLPIAYSNAPKTKIVQKTINLLGQYSYYILRKLK